METLVAIFLAAGIRTIPRAGSLPSGLLVFCSAFGTPIDPRNFNRSWDARCRKAGVRRITIDDARRTCGSLLADLDVHPQVAMRILRHADFSISIEIYTQVSSKATRKRSSGLGRASKAKRSCTPLLYGHKKGHVRRWDMASELVGALLR